MLSHPPVRHEDDGPAVLPTLVAAQDVQRRAEIALEPLDAGSVDVRAPELRLLRLSQEVPKGAPGPTTEVEHSLAAERPVVGQELEQRGLGLSAELLVGRERVAPPRQRANPAGQLHRWIRRALAGNHAVVRGIAAPMPPRPRS